MDSIGDKLVVIIGGVLVALLAGFFSYLNLVVSKEQKVSEFREKWINSLREEIAAYIAAVSHLASCFVNFKNMHKAKGGSSPEDRLDFFTAQAGSYDSVRDNYNRITLRINPNEPNTELKKINDAFLSVLEETRALYNDDKHSEAKKKCHALRDAAIPLLKAEWNRVRDGEPAYQKAKAAALRTLLVGVAASVIALLIVLFKPADPTSSNGSAANIYIDKSQRAHF